MQRVGQGFDVHIFAENRKLILGGVEFESELGLLGHSDADVLAHAINDALLGAAALQDIGYHFPDTDMAYKDADSLEMMKTVVEILDQNGFTPYQVDATVICERPKVSPRRDEMRAKVAAALGIPMTHVSIKGTTTEKLGFTGRGEGIACMAVATILEKE